jgi:hypothetical protein
MNDLLDGVQRYTRVGGRMGLNQRQGTIDIFVFGAGSADLLVQIFKPPKVRRPRGQRSDGGLRDIGQDAIEVGRTLNGQHRNAPFSDFRPLRLS